MTTEDTALAEQLVEFRALREHVTPLAEKVLLATKWGRGITQDEKIEYSFQLADKFVRRVVKYRRGCQIMIKDLEPRINEQLKSVTQPTTEEHGDTDD